MSDIANTPAGEEQDDQPLFPVYQIERGEGIMFLVAPASDYVEDIDAANAVQEMLNENIYTGPSSLDAETLIESGNYDLLYADGAALVEQEFDEELSTTFCVTSVTVVDSLVLVHAMIGLDPDMDEYEEEDEEAPEASEPQDNDWS